jgi:hypothetical protein
MGIKFTNNASSLLAAGITNSATSLSVTTGEGAEFPTLTASDYTYVTIVDAATPSTFEIVKVTARSGDTFTIVRAQEGTTARAWSTGAKVELRLTAQMLFDALAEEVSKTGDTMQGDLNFAGFRAQQPRLQSYRETVTTVTPSAGTATCDLSTANVFDLTLNAASTALAFSNAPTSGLAFSFTVIVRQDATGNRALTYPASVKFTDAVTPVLATGASKVDVLTFFTVDGGTTYFGGQALANL